MADATPTATPNVTLVDWYAPWCQPCKAMEPVLKELEAEFAGKVNFEAINVDEQGDLANANGVMSMPTFHIKKNGKIVNTLIGYQNKQEMEKVLKDAIIN
jgi:thioredoxin 1